MIRRVLAFLVLGIVLSVEHCNTTHYDFLGKYSLGKQEELNKTFTHMQQSIKSLEPVVWHVNDTLTYTLSNVKPTFYYKDTKQVAEVLGNDTIVITNGTLDVEFTFTWNKNAIIPRNGTGSAGGLSDVITFAKQVVIRNDSFYSYELLDAGDVTWGHNDTFKIRRIDPPATTDEDIENIRKLLNTVMGVKTVRDELQTQIDKSYTYLLRNSLHDQHAPIDVHFDYHWNPTTAGKPNVTIPFNRRPIMIDVQPEGVQFSFEVRIPDYDEWKCGDREVPHSYYNPKTFGGIQQFISFDFYENVLHYAVTKKILHSDLNRRNWESRMFQFFAGDLYEVIPKVRELYYASEPVDGQCEATTNGLKVWKSHVQTFNVSIHYDCKLKIANQNVAAFGLSLQLEVEGHAKTSHVDFKLRAHDENVHFEDTPSYPIAHQDLARAMIHHSVNRLYFDRLFGSGWATTPPRDYPHLICSQNYTIVYDSTHIQPDTLEEALLQAQAQEMTE